MTSGCILPLVERNPMYTISYIILISYFIIINIIINIIIIISIILYYKVLVLLFLLLLVLYYIVLYYYLLTGQSKDRDNGRHGEICGKRLSTKSVVR